MTTSCENLHVFTEQQPFHNDGVAETVGETVDHGDSERGQVLVGLEDGWGDDVTED